MVIRVVHRWPRTVIGILSGLTAAMMIAFFVASWSFAGFPQSIDPSTPQDSEAIKFGAMRIREMKSFYNEVLGLSSKYGYLMSAMVILGSTGDVHVLGSFTAHGLASFNNVSLISRAGALLSMDADVVTRSLQLQSNYVPPDNFTPAPAGAIFANTIFAAFALVSATPTTSVMQVLASYNVMLVSEVVNGIYLVSLRRPMATDHYVVIATSTRVFGENDVSTTQHDTLASFHDSFGAFRRRYFTIIRRTGSTGTLAKSSFSFLVIGAQE